MATVLDSRVIRMTRWLLEQRQPRSTADLAADLGLSERVIRYRLGVVENYLESMGAQLTRRRGYGLLLEVTAEQRVAIEADLADRVEAPRVYTPEEREYIMIDALLWAAPGVLSLDQMNRDLEVSKASARRDLQRCEPWLERNGLPVVRRPGKGITLAGSEREIRRAMVQLFLEAIPAAVLAELATTHVDAAQLTKSRMPGGLRDRFAQLPFRLCAEAVRNRVDELGHLVGDGELVLALYLAVTAERCNQGHLIRLDAGVQVSLTDHPASAVAALLARDLGSSGTSDLPPEERAGVTEYLLGLNALAAVGEDQVDIAETLDLVLAMAGQSLHASLADDAELRDSLGMHFGRLAVRLRHGLPVHNPLLAEVKERYPDVYDVAVDLGAVMAQHFDAPIAADEIGFVTMYLSGALERANLRPRRKALVVCPSGMATAWVLVSRVQAEFPELAISQVLSAREFADLDDLEFDVVISTIPLETRATGASPVVVVSPLLSQADVQRVTSLLNTPA